MTAIKKNQKNAGSRRRRVADDKTTTALETRKIMAEVLRRRIAMMAGVKAIADDCAAVAVNAVALGVSINGYEVKDADVREWMAERVDIPHGAVVPLCLTLGIAPNELYEYGITRVSEWRDFVKSAFALQNKA